MIQRSKQCFLVVFLYFIIFTSGNDLKLDICLNFTHFSANYHNYIGEILFCELEYLEIGNNISSLMIICNNGLIGWLFPVLIDPQKEFEIQNLWTKTIIVHFSPDTSVRPRSCSHFLSKWILARILSSNTCKNFLFFTKKIIFLNFEWFASNYTVFDKIVFEQIIMIRAQIIGIFTDWVFVSFAWAIHQVWNLTVTLLIILEIKHISCHRFFKPW